METISISKNDISKTELKGNFLFEENNAYHFSQNFLGSTLYVESASAEKNFDIDLKSHFESLVEAYKNSASQPSFIFYNDEFELAKQLNKTHEMVEADQITKLTDAPCYCSAKNATELHDILETLIRTRTDLFPSNTIFAIINNPCSEKIDSYEMISTVSRSRRIFLHTIVKNKAEFEKLYSPEILEIVESNTKAIFELNNDRITNIKA